MCFLLPLAASAGCVYDPADRCGPNMAYLAAGASCVCDQRSIAVAGGCEPCADDEVVANNTCACPSGQVKNDVGVCAVVPGLGDPCDTAASTCTDATYDFCAPTGVGTGGTCTNRCDADSDCSVAQTCATWETTPYCRAFTGVGKTCSGAADCVGLDAMMCDTQQSHTCVVAGCSLDDQDCPRDTNCCDVGPLVGFPLTVCLAVCP